MNISQSNFISQVIYCLRKYSAIVVGCLLVFCTCYLAFAADTTESANRRSAIIALAQTGNPEISQAAMNDNGPKLLELIVSGSDVNATNKS